MKNSLNKKLPYNNGSKNILEMTGFRLIGLTAVFIVLFDNFSFFSNVTAAYPVELKNLVYLFSLTVLLVSITILLFSIFCFKYTTKPVLIIILLASSIASYFMNNYKIVIDETMIKNIFETNSRETFDLLSFKLFIYLALAGILPSIIICKIKIRYKSFKKELLSKLIVVSSVLLIILVSFLPLRNFYFSFFREHKHVRYYANPAFFSTPWVSILNTISTAVIL